MFSLSYFFLTFFPFLFVLCLKEGGFLFFLSWFSSFSTLAGPFSPLSSSGSYANNRFCSFQRSHHILSCPLHTFFVNKVGLIDYMGLILVFHFFYGVRFFSLIFQFCSVFSFSAPPWKVFPPGENSFSKRFPLTCSLLNVILPVSSFPFPCAWSPVVNYKKYLPYWSRVIASKPFGFSVLTTMGRCWFDWIPWPSRAKLSRA